MIRYLMCIICAFAIGAPSKAPTHVMSINGDSSDKEVYLQKLDVKIDVVGNVATTTMTMTFKNTTNKILEKELTIPLPDGATVSRYALDINGKMREAVPVDKTKGTQVFEAIERRRVDPGLLEKVEGNNFRTRIYPIAPNGSRCITIGYEQELTMAGSTLYYKLPMAYKEKIERFSVNATVWKTATAPKIEDGFPDEIKFDNEGANYVAKFSREDYVPQNVLSIALPKQTDVAEVLMQPAGGSYYFLVNNFVKSISVAKKWNDNIGIIWDASLSGLQRNTKKELALLGSIIGQKKNVTIRVGLLNNTFTNGGTFNIENGDWSELRKMLESVVYDGGTNFNAIDLSTISSGEYILFSDGVSSFGDENFTVKNPVHCVVSSPQSNYSLLKWITLTSGGKFINLNELSESELQNTISQDALQFMGIKNASGVREVYPSVKTDVRNGNMSIAGIADADNTTVTLLYGIDGKVMRQQTVELDVAKYSGDNSIVSRVWAQKKIAEMDVQYEKNKEDIIALGQQFGIVTRGTSLIVLETLQDYITYQIAPPEELRAEYAKYMQQLKGRNVTAAEENTLLESAKMAATDLKTWWNKSFKIQAPKYPAPNKVETVQFTPPQVVRDVAIGNAEQVSTTAADVALNAPPSANKMEEVVVMGYGMAKRSEIVVRGVATTTSIRNTEIAADSVSRKQLAQPTISIADIKEDKDYLKKLTGDSKKDYSLYIDLRKNYLSTAAFYFDMAKWFCKLKDTTTAIKILSSIADLEFENAGLFKTLAYRLKEYNDFKDELFVTKKVVQWRPMEPQSYRDYALALTDNGLYQQALDTLYGVLTRPYEQNISNINSGIVEVFVSEINQLIALHGKKLNYRTIDTALIKAMPVDVRVVISWNMNDTDIDLHVTDPNNEECFYSNPKTATGGRISADITTGYGPEQFMVKKAVKGKYKIKVNYFGDRQIKNEGPSTVMAEIYTNYSNGSQQRKLVCLQMSKELKASGDGNILVGEFTF